MIMHMLTWAVTFFFPSAVYFTSLTNCTALLQQGSIYIFVSVTCNCMYCEYTPLQACILVTLKSAPLPEHAYDTYSFSQIVCWLGTHSLHTHLNNKPTLKTSFAV